MSQKRYWKGLEELENTPEYQASVANEFNEELPLGVSDSLLNATTPRRDFLKFLGFSTLAATVAASCEMPVRKAIPYAIKPEDITPGVPNYYASTFVDNGEVCSVVVKTRDGRPIMIEGNKSSTITKGGSSSRVIAATLGLYDKTRLRQPHVDGKPADTFDQVDGPISAGLANASGSVVLLTATVNSPSTEKVIASFLAKYPNSKHVQYDPISYSGILTANLASYGKAVIPTYAFDKADTIFSLAADFLGTWLSPVEFTAGYTSKRKIKGKDAKNATMSKHYQVEGMLSMTGANADERATCKPSEYGKVAAALLAAIQTGAAAKVGSETLNTLINKAAADLKKGNGLVVCGSNDENLQIIVNAINSAIGANGNTIDFASYAKYKQGSDIAMAQLVQEMNNGQVGALLIHGVNPVYDYYDSAKFVTGLAKVKTTVSFADRLDETAQKCKFVVSDHHWLESWGDAEPINGFYSFIQPTIAPLFKTRAYQDSLLKWSGSTETYHDIFNKFWVEKLGGQTNFDKALQDGVAEPATRSFGGASFNGNVNDAITKATSVKGGDYELVIYENITMGYGGAWSNNPWLQELSDPITRAAWDNYIMMSPKTAKEKFQAELTSINQVDANKRVLKITVNGKELLLPVIVTPGMHNNVIAVAIGYGRDKQVGKAAADLGKNIYPFATFNGTNVIYNTPVGITATETFYAVGVTQTHNSAEGRLIIREYTLEEFKKNPNELIDSRKEELGHYIVAPWESHGGHEEGHEEGEFDAKKFEEDFAKNGTPYPVHDALGLKWGMSIDLSSCTGCGACVIACHAENNVSVVGKEEVIRVHDMAWLKIDRYFSGDPENPDTIQTVFQPMLCQHCDNAPCENVCPVSATNHSSEGLNQMVYNRCIGTKYCANNCPFKVRRFNWFDWNDADCFEDNLFEDGRRDDINDDLTRMVLNPDVTVRSRGVMEKCSFCVQRLQDGKLQAKKEGNPLKDHHVSTACQAACASGCITFGNVNDKESAVFQERYVDNKERLFYMLEQIHVLPNVSYLSKIRNTDVVISATEKDEVRNQHI